MEYVTKLPAEMLKEAKHQGKVELMWYFSSTYEGESSRRLHKKAYVYLPYGYDEKKQYNVLYLLHGGFRVEDYWFFEFPETVNILDNMIEKGLCEPFIVVTPTYYHGRGDKNSANESRTINFRHELRNDLIPAVGRKYSTYLGKDLSVENMQKTRDHRAIAGLSLGSMTTYRSGLYSNFDIFSWYGPYSGCTGPFGKRDEEVTKICETLQKGLKEGYRLDYMFCCNGDKDIAFVEHNEIMSKVIARCDILKKGVNYDFFVIPGGKHDMDAWQLDLYLSGQIFFRK